MAVEIPLEGVALAYVTNPYDFTDRTSGERIQGVSRKLFIGQAFDKEPVLVKVREDKEEDVYGLELGTPVECTVSIHANGDSISYQLVSLSAAVPA